MRRLTMVLTIGFLFPFLGSPGLATATTPGATCRVACKPRVLEQCGALAGAARRRCRRPLVRACKATSPAIACETTAELEGELGDRRVQTGDPALPAIALCADGRFTARATTGDPGSPVQVITTRTGTWQVRIEGGGLTVDFDDGVTPPLAVAHDETGALLVDGRATDATDATAVCNPAPAAPDPNELDAERVVALARTVTDRALVIDAPDGDPNARQELRLCSSGRAVSTIVTQGPTPTATSVRGTWTIRPSGSEAILALQIDSGGAPTFGIDVRADGSVLIDDAPVAVNDARQGCADEELADRLTAALGGQAFFFVRQVGNLLVRTKLGLCDSGRYRIEATSAQVGEWRVRVIGGVGTIAFEDDAGNPLSLQFATAFDATGGITVEGTAPIDEPGLVSAACQG